MKQRFLSVSILLLLVVFVRAQVKWKEVTAEFGTLPKSIRVFKSTDSLKGRPFIGYYVEVNLKDKKLDVTTQTGSGKRYTPDQYYVKENAPYIVVNGTFFSFETNQNLNMIMKDGKLVAYNLPALKSKNSDSFYYPTRGAIGFTKNRRPDVAWVFTDTAQQWPYAFQQRPVVARGLTSDPAFKNLRTLDQWKWWKMQTAIGGGPVVVQAGEVHVTNKEEQMFVNGENDRHPRTAMGYTGNRKLIILVVQGRFPGIAEGVTLEEEGQILADLDCVEALNLDGGGSSCLLVNGKDTIKPSDKEGQRAVPGILMIRAK